MEIVINLPDGFLTKELSDDDITFILVAIANGTQLPKGHGRLIDADDIWNNIPDINVLTNHFTTYDIQHFIDNAPTIIEGSDENEDSN